MATQEEKDKLHNFQGKNVSDTYTRLLQKSDENRVLDGEGNAPQLLVFPGDIYISGSITAETTTTTVSESIILQSTLSGSTKFGDSSDDTHQFTGSMFVTGDIIPNTTGEQNIGSVTKPFKSLFIASQSLNIVSGSETAILSYEGGSVQSNVNVSASFTGDLVGTASNAEFSETAATADTANFAQSAAVADNVFATMSISGSETIIADSTADTLSITGSEFGIKIVGDSNNDGITFELQDSIRVAGNIYMGESNTLVGASSDTYWVQYGSDISYGVGNIGIGNIKPPSALTVEGDISASGDLYIKDGLITSDTLQGAANLGVTTAGQTTVNGDLIVTGSITAQEYNVSSSVSHMTYQFSSGSTIFGDSLDDTHQFTGSLDITGSVGGGGLNVDTITANNIGTQTDTDLLQLSDDNLLINGSISGSVISGSDIYASGDIFINGNQQIARGTSFKHEVYQITSTPSLPLVWDLVATPVQDSENVFFNGLRLAKGADYDYEFGPASNRITFNSEIIFRIGDVLSIQYSKYI